MVDFSFSAPNPGVFTLLVSMMYTPIRSCSYKTIIPLAKLVDLVFDGNCKRPLNILQVLSGSSLGRDKMVILKFYCALIHAKSEYGSFVYSSASKSKLSILDAVHNAGMHLATGAFCTSHFSNTYVELWEWPLFLWRDLLLCSYTAKLAVHPHHPSYSAVFRPSLHYRYEIIISFSTCSCMIPASPRQSPCKLFHELFLADVLPFHSGLSVSLFVMCILLNTELMKHQSLSTVTMLQRYLYVNYTV